MKKYLSIFILLIAVFLLGLSCSKNVKKDSIATPLVKNEEISKCLSSQSSSDQVTCIIALAHKENNESLCANISLTSGIDVYKSANVDNCYRELALKKKEISICNKMINNTSKEQCMGYFAEMNNDVSICDSLKEIGPRDNCFSTIGVARQDFTICDKANQPGYKYKCYIVIVKEKRDASLCEKILDENYKNYCYNDLANLVNETGNDINKLDSQRVSDIKQIQTALELYYADCNQYPIATAGQPNGAVGCKGKSTFLTYLPRIPIDPATDKIYTYTQLEKGQDYSLVFNLETQVGGITAGTHTATSKGIK